MASSLLRSLRRLSVPSLLSAPLSFRPILQNPEPIITLSRPSLHFSQNPQKSWWVIFLSQKRSSTHGSVSLVISPQGKPKFETHETEPPKKEKWKTKKRLKLQRKREKQKRKDANKRDPRRLGVKGNKKRQRFANAEERIKYKLEKAKIKEALLIERLKRYEVAQAQGPVVEPHKISGEERFYMKKMAQKRSNYVPVGRRGIFGGVILNMHLHWKKHETVKVICKPCKPGQVHEYANEIARLSGGIPIHVIGDDTIIFYRGKNYVQPEVMSPVDTLSKKRALEKSKYEQSLESVRRFIAIAEKELELYYRHVALYGDPNNRDPKSILDCPKIKHKSKKIKLMNMNKSLMTETGREGLSEMEADFTDQELSELEDDDLFNEDSVSSNESMGDVASCSVSPPIYECKENARYKETRETLI
ncbi:RNA-binding CRS1/YhbY (CRM) domain protein [Forsythia ovata]|uniref:RNA-binding CRS1/YhbY (CRM) domain protein n=1 Tax=Forsythia ovata TaxID=205694 RepID=A0ABD1UYP4_9LAMI